MPTGPDHPSFNGLKSQSFAANVQQNMGFLYPLHVVSKTRLLHDGSSGVMSKTCSALRPDDDNCGYDLNASEH